MLEYNVEMAEVLNAFSEALSQFGKRRHTMMGNVR